MFHLRLLLCLTNKRKQKFENAMSLYIIIIIIIIIIIAELWRTKPACGAPWVSKSTHPRKFGNHVTVHRPSAPQGNQCSILTLSTKFGSTGRLIFHIHIAHQCCDQLTAVKTGYPLTSITDRIAGSGVDPSRSSIFLKLSADKLLVFK